MQPVEKAEGFNGEEDEAVDEDDGGCVVAEFGEPHRLHGRRYVFGAVPVEEW